MIDLLWYVIPALMWMAAGVPAAMVTYDTRVRDCRHSRIDMCDVFWCAHWIPAAFAGLLWPVMYAFVPSTRPELVTSDERKLRREIKQAQETLKLMKLREDRELIYRQIREREDRILEG